MEQHILMNKGGYRALDSQVGAYLDEEFLISEATCKGKVIWLRL